MRERTLGVEPAEQAAPGRGPLDRRQVAGERRDHCHPPRLGGEPRLLQRASGDAVPEAGTVGPQPEITGRPSYARGGGLSYEVKGGANTFDIDISTN
jgi:hypothetical protein